MSAEARLCPTFSPAIETLDPGKNPFLDDQLILASLRLFTGNEKRLRQAMEARASQIEPSTDGLPRIEEKLMDAQRSDTRKRVLIGVGCLCCALSTFGFLVLLSSLWITTATPLNSPKGRPPGWKVIEVVDDPSASNISAVHDIVDSGDPVDVEGLAQLRPATPFPPDEHATDDLFDRSSSHF